MGRFGDKCKRIQDTSVDLIDQNKLSAYKGAVDGALTKIQEDKVKVFRNSDRIFVNSQLEFKDQHLSNSAYNLKEQNVVLQKIEEKKNEKNKENEIPIDKTN